MKLTIRWKNGKVTETVTDDPDWYVKLLRSNKQTWVSYMLEQSEKNSVTNNLDIIQNNIKLQSQN